MHGFPSTSSESPANHTDILHFSARVLAMISCCKSAFKPGFAGFALPGVLGVAKKTADVMIEAWLQQLELCERTTIDSASLSAQRETSDMRSDEVFPVPPLAVGLTMLAPKL